MVTSRFPVVSFIAAELLALLANSAFLIVFPWLVLSYTGSASLSSAVRALVMIPTAVATLGAGRVIDRMGRKKTSIFAGLGCTFAAIALCVADGIGGLSVPLLIVLGMCAQLFVSPSTTARDALMGDIAAASGMSVERLAGTRQVMFSIAYAVGPAIAGVLLALTKSYIVVGFIAAAWAIAVVLTTLLPAGMQPVSKGARAPRIETSLGAVLRSRRSVRAALVIGFGTSVISAPMTSVLLPAHFTALGQPQLYGLVVSAFAVGALIGSLAYAVLAKRVGVGMYVAAVVVATIGIAGFSVLPPAGLLATALGLGGVGSGLLAPMLLVAVTKSTSEHERGRALGAYNAASLGAGPIGLALLGVLLHSTSGLYAGTLGVLAVWVVVAGYALISVKADRQRKTLCH